MKKAILLSTLIVLFASCFGYSQPGSPSGVTQIELKTDSGSIIILLYNETVQHKDNFIKLINTGFYDGLLFHRLIKDFMIQGGDPNSKNATKGEMLGQGGPGYSIPAEILPQYYHKKGALAAARKGNDVNPSRSSSGSQFYIVQGKVFTLQQLEMMVNRKSHAPFTQEQIKTYTSIGGTPHLDGEYTVFGEIISGFEVLDKIMNVPVDPYDRPINDLKFSMRILE